MSYFLFILHYIIEWDECKQKGLDNNLNPKITQIDPRTARYDKGLQQIEKRERIENI